MLVTVKEERRGRESSAGDGRREAAVGGSREERVGEPAGTEGKELKEVMKIRRSRKGAYDMRMRRSTRKTGALILDLVTLTPAGLVRPRLLHAFAHAHTRVCVRARARAHSYMHARTDRRA